MGTRIRIDKLEFNPVLPPTSSKISLVGVDYFGSEFDITVEDVQTLVNFTTVRPDQPLVVYSEESDGTRILGHNGHLGLRDAVNKKKQDIS